MPLIHIYNWWEGSAGTRRSTRAAAEIQRAALKIRALGLTELSQVNVFYGPTEPGDYVATKRVITIVVDLLFERPERTPDVRARLMKAIGCVMRRYAARGQRIQVFDRPFNQQTTASWNGKGAGGKQKKQ